MYKDSFMTNYIFEATDQQDAVTFPCSATQKQFWLLNRIMPDNPAYNIPLAFIAGADFDLDVLQRCFQTLVARHEVLHSLFKLDGDELTQQLLENYQFVIEPETLPADVSLEDYAQERCSKAFNLEFDTAFRASCTQLPDGRYLIIFCFHHIAVDHSAVLIFEQEFKTLFQAYSNGETCELPELEVQFGDYVLWYNENYTDEDLEPAYTFWQDLLQGHSGELNLPLDIERQPDNKGKGSELIFHADKPHSDVILQFTRQRGLSPYVAGLTALKVLLHRYSGQSDIIIGSPFTERGQLEELENVVGCFLNMLPLASHVHGHETFLELIDQQNIVFQGALDNAIVSIEGIINRTNMPRKPGMNPVFQAGFTFQDPPADMAIPGVQIESLPVYSGGAMYDLHLWLWDDNGQLGGLIWYAAECFHESTIKKFADDFQSLYARLATNPDVPVSTLLGAVHLSEFDADLPANALSSASVRHFAAAQEPKAPVLLPQVVASCWTLTDSVTEQQIQSRLAELSQQKGVDLSRVIRQSGDAFEWESLSESVALQTHRCASVSDAQAIFERSIKALETPSLGNPLTEVHWVSCDDGASLLAVLAHPSCMDAAAVNALGGFLIGAESAVDPVPYRPQFKPDYHAHSAHLSRFWKDYVGSEWEVLSLVPDSPRALEFLGAADKVSLQISADQSNGVVQMAQQLGVSVPMLWLSILGLLLYRHTQQDEFGLGVAVDTAASGMVGSNVLPFRMECDGAETITSVVERVSRDVTRLCHLGAFPYNDIVAYSPQNDGELDRLPLTQALIRITGHSGDHSAQRTTLKPRVQGDLEFDVVVGSDSVAIDLAFARDVFSANSMQALLDRLPLMISGLLKGAHQTVDLLPIERPEDKAEKVGVAQGPEYELLAPNMVDMFKDSFQQHGDRVALLDENQSLTYDELWARAGEVAQVLVEKELQGTLVALYLDRTVDMIVALLGVLRAGATYVPLDPDNPLERIRVVLEDSGAKCCITDKAHEEGLNSLGLPISMMPIESFEPASNPIDLDTIHCDAAQPAFVIFTSGSTGRPKGVAIPHRAVVNFFQFIADKPGMNKDDIVLATTTLSFDMAVIELLIPLIVGARAFIATRRDAVDGARLQHLIDTQGVTFLQATPTSWRILLASGWTGSARMKALSGGEALTSDLRDQLLPKVKELWNCYGPTETTVDSTVKHVLADTPSSCIGAPVGNTTVHVMNVALQPQPLGVMGELCIGGLGLALGYYGRDDLTAERFVTLPDGERVYRTGDRVYQDRNGEVHYFGRLDDQVKIRGYRIELGEIEARLREQPHIENAVVIVVGKTAAERRLIAYYQVDESGEVSAAELKAALSASLASYMVPQQFVLVDIMPRTSSGKVDKKRLAAMPLPEIGEDDHLSLDQEASQAIAALDEVAEAVVVIDANKKERFCHYLLENDAYINPTALRKLGRELGKDGLPLRQFQEVEVFSKDENGAIAWRSLYDSASSDQSPQTDMEKYIHKLWCELFARTNIKRSDNFFDIGGHSLLAVQVLVRLREDHGIQISQDKLLMGTLEVFALECEKHLKPETTDDRELSTPSEQRAEPVEKRTENIASEEAEREPSTSESDEPSQQPEGKDDSKGLLSRFFKRKK